MRGVFSWLAFVFLFASVRGPLVAQSISTSAVRGVVASPEGAPVAVARITLTHGPTGTSNSALSDPEGRFVLRLLPPGGPYLLEVEALGFGTVRREELRLRVGETLQVEIELRPTAIPVEGIQVRVRQDLVFQTSQIGPVTLLDRELVQAMPLLSRDLMELSVLSPLVKTSEGGFSIAGQNDRYNAILVDGVVSKDAFGLTAGGIPGGQAGAGPARSLRRHRHGGDDSLRQHGQPRGGCRCVGLLERISGEDDLFPRQGGPRRRSA